MIENLNGTEQLCRAPHKMCLSLAMLNWLENQSPYKTVLLQLPINVLFNGYTKGHKIACLEYIKHKTDSFEQQSKGTMVEKMLYHALFFLPVKR